MRAKFADKLWTLEPPAFAQSVRFQKATWFHTKRVCRWTANKISGDLNQHPQAKTKKRSCKANDQMTTQAWGSEKFSEYQKWASNR